MSEEKKNLTEEERKELKEGLKKQIDEMSDEELDKVAGGFEMWTPGVFFDMRYKFTEEEVNKLSTLGFKLEPNQVYKIDEVIKIFHIDLIGAHTTKEIEERVELFLKNNFGLSGCKIDSSVK
ncbi:hypothetical protein SAMN02910289_00831 [Lachnospiraceae bacterium RM5]|nr:hypothetical protein SAMN02910289_00831 [Lachnospiraceae bacterium RM5]